MASQPTDSPFSHNDVCHKQESLPAESDCDSISSNTPLLMEMNRRNNQTLSRLDHFLLCISSFISTNKKVLVSIKVAILFILTFLCMVIFVSSPEFEDEQKSIAINNLHPHFENITYGNRAKYLLVKLKSRYFKINDEQSDDIYQTSNGTYSIRLLVENCSLHCNIAWPVQNYENENDIEVQHTFELQKTSGSTLLIASANISSPLAFNLVYIKEAKSASNSVIYAALVLVGVYLLIIFELTHRTIAAMLGCLSSTAILAQMGVKPSLNQLMEWVDYETLALLWGMMTLVGIFADTGIFDYCALKMYRISKGRIWVLITLLCLFAGIVSAFIDNVTTILLMTPITIRLCEIMNVDPRHVLIATVIFSNVGGTATAVGDPPNVIIISDNDIQKAGIDFAKFTLHMFIGIVFCFIIAYGLLRLMYKRINLQNKEPSDIIELRQEIKIWNRAAARIAPASREENTVKALLLQKVVQLENLVNNKLHQTKRTDTNTSWKDNLNELENKYKIVDQPLLVKSSCVMVVTILMFFIYSFLPIDLDLGWIAVFGALLLLVLSDITHLEVVMERIEWATLLFFAALFILMESLTELGLMDAIASTVSEIIKGVPPSSQLPVAIILILWVSALASAFIDNIPFTTAMIPVVVSLNADPALNLPIEPLVWSLAYGACLGGNGTLIGASANVVCAGVAEQHGYKITFGRFFKVGFPMMLVTVFVAMCYLLICHVAFEWNY